MIFVFLALLLSLDDHQVALDLLLELGCDIRLIYLLSGGLVLYTIEQRIIFLFLVEGFELVLQRLLVVVRLSVALKDAGFLLVSREDLGQAAIVGLVTGSDPMLLVMFKQRQHKMLAHAVWLF